jgi:hypothetical protein
VRGAGVRRANFGLQQSVRSACGAGAIVRMGNNTMVITAWGVEHGDECGVVFLNDFALGAFSAVARDSSRSSRSRVLSTCDFSARRRSSKPRRSRQTAKK